MNLYRGIITTCFLLATAGGGSAQADRAADRKEIANGYVRSSKAMKQKDVKGLTVLMTKDATFKEADGSLTPRSKLEAMMKQMFSMLTYTQIKPTITKWAWQSNTATLDVTTHSAGTLKNADGKTHTVTYVSKSRDHWVKQADGWRLQQIEAVSESMTEDGKPVMIPAPTPKK